MASNHLVGSSNLSGCTIQRYKSIGCGRYIFIPAISPSIKLIAHKNTRQTSTGSACRAGIALWLRNRQISRSASRKCLGLHKIIHLQSIRGKKPNKPILSDKSMSSCLCGPYANPFRAVAHRCTVAAFIAQTCGDQFCLSGANMCETTFFSTSVFPCLVHLRVNSELGTKLPRNIRGLCWPVRQARYLPR